jgi:hypothetical protein
MRISRPRKISAVLQHDLRADANTGGRLIIQAHGGMSGVDMSMSTSISRGASRSASPTLTAQYSVIQPKGLKTKHHNERHPAHLRRVETPVSGRSSASLVALVHNRCNGATCVTLRLARWRPRGGGR